MAEPRGWRNAATCDCYCHASWKPQTDYHATPCCIPKVPQKARRTWTKEESDD